MCFLANVCCVNSSVLNHVCSSLPGTAIRRARRAPSPQRGWILAGYCKLSISVAMWGQHKKHMRLTLIRESELWMANPGSQRLCSCVKHFPAFLPSFLSTRFCDASAVLTADGIGPMRWLKGSKTNERRGEQSRRHRYSLMLHLAETQNKAVVMESQRKRLEIALPLNLFCFSAAVIWFVTCEAPTITLSTPRLCRETPARWRWSRPSLRHAETQTSL